MEKTWLRNGGKLGIKESVTRAQLRVAQGEFLSPRIASSQFACGTLHRLQCNTL